MFGKKKEKKESSTSGGTSSYHETTTVQNIGNGSIFTRRLSTETSHTRSVIREERSHIIHSSTTGDIPRFLDRNNPFTTSLPMSSRIGNFTFNSNFPALEKDARPYLRTTSGTTASSNRLPAPQSSTSSSLISRSYPLLARQQPLAIQSASTSLSSSLVPTYEHKSLNLGKALVINNVKFFDKKDERAGAERDSTDLKKLLKDIGFKVDVKKDLKGKEISKEIQAFCKSNFKDYGISIVVVMSHGNNLINTKTGVKSVRGGFTQIAGIDNVPVATDEIIEMFTTGNCHPSLTGKPKIFIFQCCRGERDLEVCHDTVPIKTPTKQHSDILIAYSTLPGYLSNRNPKTGTWYIQSICEVFGQHHKSFHVEEMLKIVDDQLGKFHPQYTQTSTYESRGFKTCFLFKRP